LPKVIKRGTHTASPSSPPSSRRSAPPSSGRGRKPIAKKDVVEARAAARSLRAEAEEQATGIIDQARREAEELRQKGYEEGYQEGLGQYTEQTTSALMQIESYRAQVEPEYIRLVSSCVERIIGEELKLNPEAVIGVVRSALKDAVQQREVNVRIHPDDVAALRKHQRRLVDALARANTIEVREDATVARGGCIIMTELGTIDASLERQLVALQTVLDDELTHGDPNAVFSGEVERFDDDVDDMLE